MAGGTRAPKYSPSAPGQALCWAVTSTGSEHPVRCRGGAHGCCRPSRPSGTSWPESLVGRVEPAAEAGFAVSEPREAPLGAPTTEAPGRPAGAGSSPCRGGRAGPRRAWAGAWRAVGAEVAPGGGGRMGGSGGATGGLGWAGGSRGAHARPAAPWLEARRPWAGGSLGAPAQGHPEHRPNRRPPRLTEPTRPVRAYPGEVVSSGERGGVGRRGPRGARGTPGARGWLAGGPGWGQSGAVRASGLTGRGSGSVRDGRRGA